MPSLVDTCGEVLRWAVRLHSCRPDTCGVAARRIAFASSMRTRGRRVVALFVAGNNYTLRLTLTARFAVP